MVQWLRLCTSKAGVMGSIPGQGTNIPHATWSSHKKEKNVALVQTLSLEGVC